MMPRGHRNQDFIYLIGKLTMRDLKLLMALFSSPAGSLMEASGQLGMGMFEYVQAINEVTLRVAAESPILLAKLADDAGLYRYIGSEYDTPDKQHWTLGRILKG
jgi:hypothetical protein